MAQLISALAWDVDGILVDTENLKFLAWTDLLQERGVQYTLKEYKLVVGQSFVNILDWLGKHKGIYAEKDEFKSCWLRYYNERRKGGVALIYRNIQLLKDFHKFLPQMPKVAASSDAENIDSNLELAGVRDIFLATVSPKNHKGIRSKPAPDIYLLAVKLLGIPADRCLAFEDSQPGVIAAKEAGLKCVALPNLFTEKQDFSRADHIFPSKSSLVIDEIIRKGVIFY